MSPRVFSQQQEFEILQMRAIGIPTKDIVAEHGHRNAVYGLFCRAGVETQPSGPTERRLTHLDEREILGLWDEGHSATYISKRLRRDWKTVVAIVKRRREYEQRHDKAARRGPSRRVKADGYVEVRMPDDHPLVAMRPPTKKFVLEHRLVVAEELGRCLEPYETVHHIDGDRTNNQLTNLQLRVGNHGNGVVMRCQQCGSQDVATVPIGNGEGNGNGNGND